MPQNKDREILELFHQPATQEKGFRLLVQTYQERLYWHVRRMVVKHHDADDVMQNVFIKVWKGLHNFRADSMLYTWLYRIATNETLTWLAKNKHRQTVALQADNTEEEDSYNLADNIESDPYFDGDAAQLKLQKAIATLPDKQKLVFNLKYYEDMKYDDMSEVLDTSVGALKASYHHAVKKIEKYLSKD